MNKSSIIFQQPLWWIAICLIIGLCYAFLLYRKTAPWSKTVNYILAGSRFILASTLAFLLLLNPLIRQVLNTEEKPTVIFALDNSQSIVQSNEAEEVNTLYKELDEIRKKLIAQDIEVDIQALNSEKSLSQIADVPLDVPSTNLSAMLGNVQNTYENRNVDRVVLVSDGIYNQGLSPNFRNYAFPVLSLALGDTTSQKDIKIQSVLANKVAYLGNEFPVVAEIEAVGYSGKRVGVSLSQNGRILDQKTLQFKNNQDLQSLTFYSTAKLQGTQHYVVSVEVLEDEFTDLNNSRDVYIEVIDGKEKILLAAAAPHPDIKALKTAIEKNENYEFEVYIPGLNTLKEKAYDVVIFHQIPNYSGKGNDLLKRYKDLPTFFILGSQSNLNAFNQVNGSLRVIGRRGRMDEVTPVYNRSYNAFTFENEKISMVEKLPPLYVPFGEYRVNNGARVLLNQRVGNIATEKPLLISNENASRKTAILAGEGIWQWRLEEYALSDSHESFDDLMGKIIQYLSTKEDKRRLRVYPINNEFFDFEKVVFESEVYNEVYERIYGTKINLSILDAEGNSSTYSFTSAEGNTRYEISGLKKGVYTYQASAQLEGKLERSQGQFTVKDLQLEALNTQADHNLLRQLAEKSGGKFYLASQSADLEKELLDKRKPNLIHSTEELNEVINMKWLFFVLLILASLEWGFRKYLGSY